AAEAKDEVKRVKKRKIEIGAHHRADKMNRVTLAVTPPMHGEIVYRTVCGKFLPLVTRYQTCERVPPEALARAVGMSSCGGLRLPMVGAALVEHGRMRERLILAVRVQPCAGK